MTKLFMPPKAVSDDAVAAFTLPLPLDELLPHPAASRTAPIAAATAAYVFFLRTFPPQTCMTTLGQDASIVTGESKAEVSVDWLVAVRIMNGSWPEAEFLYHPSVVRHSSRINGQCGDM
ncbi:MAG TPA: hypothetical protein VHY31_28105 [Streptosporangiaceae bacterium]|nr:hypothetical protein [Streptosporangiaceae bacterium]